MALGASGIAALISMHAVCAAAILGLLAPSPDPHHAKPGDVPTAKQALSATDARDPT